MTPFEFWTDDPPPWPVDTRSHIFLARAVGLWLQVMHGDSWAEHARLTAPPETIPANLAWATPEQLKAARHLLEKWYPNKFGDGPLDGGAWSEAFGLVQAERRALLPTQPFYNAAVTICAIAREGLLATATRPPRGGAFSPLPASAWNGEGLWHRFFFCGLEPSDPFNRVAQSDPDATMRQHWIFIEKESLAEVLTRLRGGSRSAVANYDVAPVGARIANASTPSQKQPSGRPPREQNSALEAMQQLYGDGGALPAGSTLASLTADIGEHLRSRGKQAVSTDTVRRARKIFTQKAAE